MLDAKVRLNIELKGSGTAVPVYQIVGKYLKNGPWKRKDLIISSFKWDELEAMRKQDKKMPIAVLTGKDPLAGIPVAKTLHAEAINPNYNTLTPEVCQKIKAAGLKIYVWTVNEPQDIEAMKALGVDGIITNFPDRVE